MKSLTLLIILFLFSCTSVGVKSSPTSVNIGGRAYMLINIATVQKYLYKADAVVYWRQESDDAIIQTSHNGERKEGSFFIPNLANGLEKLHKGRKTIIMVIDKKFAQHSRTSTILNSLNPKKVKTYICYFNDGAEPEK